MGMLRISLLVCLLVGCGDDETPLRDDAAIPPDTSVTDPLPTEDPVMTTAGRLITEGRETFRFDTFGDEAFWGGTLKLHEAIATLGPNAVLGLGLKVDRAALPDDVIAALAAGQVDLDDPANTLLLLRANAVIGVTGFFATDGTLSSIGIQCAFCHTTVDNSFAPGIGDRLDGWPNRDLNVGAIIAAAPDLSAVRELLGVDQATLQAVLASWGPGKFDAQLFLDGKAFRPDGKTAATLIPPAYGLAGVDGHTSTGWGSVTYWNALVGNLLMRGKGTFFDPRLDDAGKFPIAAANRLGHVTNPEDRITPKLAGLHLYQLALEAPKPPAGSFDPVLAESGAILFSGKAQCATCHVPPLFTEPGWNRHTPAEIGIDAFQASRSPDERYRTSPLKGLWTHGTGGYYHDGRFATLADVVDHYNAHFELGLNENERLQLVEYVKSL
jgi:hypothetical protein